MPQQGGGEDIAFPERPTMEDHLRIARVALGYETAHHEDVVGATISVSACPAGHYGLVGAQLVNHPSFPLSWVKCSVPSAVVPPAVTSDTTV